MEIKVNKSTAVVYHINHPDASYGIFCLNDKGDLFINSDYGFYGYAWRSYGPDFRAFLAQLNTDYLIGKLEINHREVSGKKMQPFRKEKLTLLCQAFINELKKENELSKS